MISTATRPMTAAEREILERMIPGGPIGRLIERLSWGRPFAETSEAIIRADLEASETEIVAIEPDHVVRVGDFETDPHALLVFESRTEGKLVVLSAHGLLEAEAEHRIFDSGKQNSLVVERAPRSGSIFRLSPGSKEAEVTLPQLQKPVIVPGCEMVAGSIDDLEDALRQCSLAQFSR